MGEIVFLIAERRSGGWISQPQGYASLVDATDGVKQLHALNAEGQDFEFHSFTADGDTVLIEAIPRGGAPFGSTAIYKILQAQFRAQAAQSVNAATTDPSLVLGTPIPASEVEEIAKNRPPLY